MKKSKFTRDIEARLTEKSPKKFKSRFKPEDFIRGNGHELSALKFLNMNIPQVRQELLNLFGSKKESLHEKHFEQMQKLWFESDIFEVKALALFWLEHQSDEFLLQHHRQILTWAEAVDNWAHSDTLCSVLARIIDVKPQALLPTYKKWNRHQNPWLRRCSMVGIYLYSRMRQNPLDFATATAFVNPHFQAKEYYVQKGVGWTIREMYNLYPTETIKYIQDNNHQLTSVAWVAASEKLPAKIKAPLLQKRKENRVVKKI